MDRLPLTPTGFAVCALSCTAYGAGWWFGWVELMVLAAGCGVSLALATPFVLGRHRLVVERVVAPVKVEVGEPSLATLSIRNPTRAPIAWSVIRERIGDQVRPIEVEGLEPGSAIEHVLNLPTNRRGRLMIGPSIISRADPMGLLRRDVVQTGQDELWVRPRVVYTAPVPVGFAKDLDGPTNDASPAGDVSFHTLREYSIGDDPRHVHWLSTARSGTLMVKHYVDNRRPHITVVLDGLAASFDGDAFEVAVAVAASIGVNGLLHEQPVSVFHGLDDLASSRYPVSADGLLDALTLVSAVSSTSLNDACSHALAKESDTSVLVVVTGALETGHLLRLVEQTKHRTHVIVVRSWSSSAIEPARLPGATLLDVDSIERFGVLWDQAIR